MFGWITLAVLISAAVVLALVWYFEGKALSKRTFICGDCGKSFSPKWWKAGFSAHMGDNTVLECPHCGKKGFCSLTYKENY